MPGVAAVDRFRTLLIDFHSRKIVAGFGDTSIRRRFGPAREAADGEAKGRQVGISYYLSARYGIRKGDTIELPTPEGPQKFIVGDVFSSYSTTSGFVYLDRKWLKKFWGLDDATQLAIYAQKGVDVDRLASEIRKRLLPRYSLDIMNNEVLRRRVFSIFDRTFSITYAIELISIIVSLIGVVNTLLALVLERKREISIIRYLGGSWKQIRETLVFSAGIVGIGGIVLGLFLGGFMSVIFIKVVNKISFGWMIHFRIPLLYLAAVSVLLFLTTLAAGLIPSKVARRIDPKRFITFE
jgi:putative ABC transport system permease protein